MADKRISTGMRLSETAKGLLEALSDKMGISQTSVVELLIREKAKTEGVTLQDREKAGATV